MLKFEYLLSMYLYLMGLLMFCFFFKNLLMTIISLEFIVVFMIFNMFIFFMMYYMHLYLIIFIMVMMVCEGVLSLSLIVLMVRYFGNDYINSLVLIMW